jgi:hypothetical protein
MKSFKSRYLIAALLLGCASVSPVSYALEAAMVTQACQNIGELANAVAKARDVGIPKTVAYRQVAKHAKDDNVEKVLNSVVDAVYKSPNLDPEELQAAMAGVCRMTLSKLQASSN